LPMPPDYKSTYFNELTQNATIIWPLIEYHYSTINYNLKSPAPTAPDAENWLGTDDQGRDVLARIIYGLRISILFGLLLTIISSAIGIFLGAVQGYFGGLTDLFMQRLIEIWSGLPMLYILIIVSSLINPNFWWLLLLMLLFSWATLVPLVRAEFLKVRNYEFVLAARAMGVAEMRIILRHILPNALVASIAFLPFILSGSITTLTALDFLGLGMPPGSPSLGELLSQGKTNLHAPWLGVSGFLCVGIILTLLIFAGEAVRDALNFERH
jgi:microcin C transport system permease protein